MARLVSEKALEQAQAAGKNPRDKDGGLIKPIEKKEPKPEYEKVLQEIVNLFGSFVKQSGGSSNSDLASTLKQVASVLDKSLKQANKTARSSIDIANATLTYLRSVSKEKQPIDLSVGIEVPEELKSKEPKKIRVHDIKRSNENLIEEFTLEEVK